MVQKSAIWTLIEETIHCMFIFIAFPAEVYGENQT